MYSTSSKVDSHNVFVSNNYPRRRLPCWKYDDKFARVDNSQWCLSTGWRPLHLVCYFSSAFSLCDWTNHTVKWRARFHKLFLRPWFRLAWLLQTVRVTNVTICSSFQTSSCWHCIKHWTDPVTDTFQSISEKSENDSVLENRFVCQDIQPKILIQVQELCESRGGRPIPRIPVLMSLMVSVEDGKTTLNHAYALVSLSLICQSDIRGQ